MAGGREAVPVLDFVGGVLSADSGAHVVTILERFGEDARPDVAVCAGDEDLLGLGLGGRVAVHGGERAQRKGYCVLANGLSSIRSTSAYSSGTLES